MDAQALARAVEDDRLRSSLADELSSEEVSAFEEYVSEYRAAEMIRSKKDS